MRGKRGELGYCGNQESDSRQWHKHRDWVGGERGGGGEARVLVKGCSREGGG